uniref:Uncharacterized protein n=1 Tax=Ailuropoda melanoleuca TaxID=9646 RepID=G1L193_AILME
MPKKAGVMNKGKIQSKEPERLLPPLGPVAVDPKGCVTIAIHAKPGSKQNTYSGSYCAGWQLEPRSLDSCLDGVLS